jgi:hypothetical protein
MRSGVNLSRPRNLEPHFRETPRSTDETLCLAILADLDTESITDIVRIYPNESETIADRRMKAFHWLYRYIPTDFLFLQSEKFENDSENEGFRWDWNHDIPKFSLKWCIDGRVPRRQRFCCNIGGFLLEIPRSEPAEKVNDVFFFYCRATNSWYGVRNSDEYEIGANRRNINGLGSSAILVQPVICIAHSWWRYSGSPSEILNYISDTESAKYIQSSLSNCTIYTDFYFIPLAPPSGVESDESEMTLKRLMKVYSRITSRFSQFS